MDNQESLRILNEMVQLTRARIRRGDGTLFLVYGYLSIVAALTHAAVLHFTTVGKFAPFAWFLLLFGWIFHFQWKKKQSAGEPATYLAKLIGQIWFSVMGSYFVALFFLGFLGNALYFVLMIILSIAIYLTGWILRFTPLKAGAIFTMACGIGSLFVPMTGALLLFATAMLAGYVLPGHLINNAKNG